MSTQYICICTLVYTHIHIYDKIGHRMKKNYAIIHTRFSNLSLHTAIYINICPLYLIYLLINISIRRVAHKE